MVGSSPYNDKIINYSLNWKEWLKHFVTLIYNEKFLVKSCFCSLWAGYKILLKLLKIRRHKKIVYALFLGAYVPLTTEGNIMVNGVLASCYPAADHDLAYFAMKPIQWFPDTIEWIFGVKKMGSNVMLELLKSLADGCCHMISCTKG